eukprot:jgi/Tetstr1/440913/TSEL_029184.t1
MGRQGGAGSGRSAAATTGVAGRCGAAAPQRAPTTGGTPAGRASAAGGAPASNGGRGFSAGGLPARGPGQTSRLLGKRNMGSLSRTPAALARLLSALNGLYLPSDDDDGT